MIPFRTPKNYKKTIRECAVFSFFEEILKEHLPDMGYTTLKGKDLGVTLII